MPLPDPEKPSFAIPRKFDIMSHLWQSLGLCLLLSLACMVVLWLISLWRKDVSIADPFWGTGFVIMAWTSFTLNSTTSPRAILLCILVTIWGLRLSLYLLWRNAGKKEDHRYAEMRTHHGSNFWWISFWMVFVLQGVLLWFIAMPVKIANLRSVHAPWNMIDVIGVLLWGTGFFFESVGDWQLSRFKADPANEGKVMDHGLWRYTRHPNYFGDFCIWWGIYLISLSAGAAWTLTSPILMSILLMRVSGVTLLESTITKRRPDYDEYRKRTSSFFPWPPSSP